MAQRRGHRVRENPCVQGQDGTCHRRHAAGQQHEEFAVGHLVKMWPDQQRRFHHAHEYRTRRSQTDGAAQPHGLVQHFRQTRDQPWNHPPVPQQGAQRREHNHQRQGAEGEHEAVLRRRHRKGCLGTAEKPEDHGGAFRRGGFNRQYQFVDQQQCLLQQRQFKNRMHSSNWTMIPVATRRRGKRRRSALVSQARRIITGSPSSAWDIASIL